MPQPIGGPSPEGVSPEFSAKLPILISPSLREDEFVKSYRHAFWR